MNRATHHLALIFVAANVLAQTPPPWPETPVPSNTERVAILADKRINESSGLDRSIHDPSIFWTMNDSGGEPCVFAIDREGKTRAKVRVRDAANFDWEDLTMGTDEKGAPALFIGDIGDNLQIRPSIQVYQIPEPAISPRGKTMTEVETAAPIIWRANYPEGRLNAESLLFHPLTRRLYILSKRDDGQSALFVFPHPMQPGVSMTLEKVIDLPFPALVRAGKRPHDNCMTTSACFSPDGSHLVVSTYSSLYEWSLPKGKPLSEALKAPPVRIEPQLVPQLEGVCYDADGRTIWFTSEHLPTALMQVKR